MSEPRVRDRQVIYLAAAVVIVVLGVEALGLLFPAFDDLIGLQPVVAIILVVVTAWVLVGALRSVRRG
jgi:hypothetical protein